MWTQAARDAAAKARALKKKVGDKAKGAYDRFQQSRQRYKKNAAAENAKAVSDAQAFMKKHPSGSSFGNKPKAAGHTQGKKSWQGGGYGGKVKISPAHYKSKR